MSDTPVELPTPHGAESIPAVLAAPRSCRKTAKPVAAAIGADSLSLPTAAAPATHVTEEPTMATTIENVAQDTGAKAEQMFGEINDRAKGAIEKGTAMFAELNSFNKGNVEALVESGKIAVAALQTIGQDRAAYLRKQFEEATAAARTIASAKSPTEFMKLQGDYVRQQFEALVSETSRSTEAMLKLAGEVAQPISNRVALAAEKMKQAA